MDIQIKYREIQEEKRLYGENRRILENSDNRHDHKETLRVEEDA